MIENILHKKIGGANLFSYFLVSALALAPSVSFADTTENNVVTASVLEGTCFERQNCKYRVNNDYTVTLVGPTDDFSSDELRIPYSVNYRDENGSVHGFPVTRIGDNAFAGKDIQRLYLPGHLEYIGENAFDVHLPLKVMIGSSWNSDEPGSIGNNAFGSSPTIYVSANHNQLEAYKSAWSEYSSSIMQHPSGCIFSNGIFEYTYEEDCLSDPLKLTKYVGQDKEVEISSTLSDPNTDAFLGWVTNWGAGLFKNNTTIETVILGGLNSGGSLPDEFFSGCTNLSKVILKGRYYNYRMNTFEGCSKDLVIYVDESDWDTYHEDPSWKGFTFKPSYLENVKDEDQYFYYSVTELKNAMLEFITIQPKELVIPSSAKFTFERKEYVVSVTSIGERVVERNTETESVTIPASIENIASRAFDGFEKLTTIIMLGSTPAKIGDNVFNKNATIFVPAGVKEVYQKAWPEYSSNIKESIAGVTFDEGNFQFKGGEDQKLTLLSYNGRDEKEVTIPEEIVHNGSSYPVTCIAENAFNSCSDLQSVNILGTKVQFSAKSFNNCSQLCEIFVPETAYDDYMKNVDLSNQQYYLAIKGAPKVLTDDEDYTGGKVIVYDKGELTYERTFQPGSQYATLCLPFSYLISETGFEEVYEPMHQIIHYTGNGDSKNNPKLILMLRKVADQLVSPGTPVFVKLGDSRKLSISNYEGVTLGRGVNNILGKSMDVVDWDGKSGLMEMNTDFKVHYNGNYKHENAADIPGLYTFNGDGTFGPQTSGKLNPYRMYIVVKNSKLPAGAKYNISIGMNNGSTTGIQEIVTAPASKEAASSNAIYDLNGRLVSTTGSTQNLHKGVYIQNGKKLVVK